MTNGMGPLMSALGQKRTLKRLHPMSALPPKADIRTWRPVLSLHDRYPGCRFQWSVTA